MNIRSLINKKERINFLHIGKTGGSQIKQILNQNKGGKFSFKTHNHRVKLRDIPINERYFFSIRDPISRFQSAFYYRKNKGLPGVFQDWLPHERIAFENFTDANNLAESLFRADKTGYLATQSMQSIAHVCSQQIDWFERCGSFNLNPPISIIRQENLDADIEAFLKKIFDDEVYSCSISKNESTIRKNKYPEKSELTALATKNLKKWFCRDLAFYENCLDWIYQNDD